MPRYKHYSYEQTKMIPISYAKQIEEGSFEHALSYLIDEELDLSVFEKRFRNDATGAPAFDPAILLKIVLYAYSKGITQSRAIARCCEENVMFMALSADTRPHFTTIADFISSMKDEIGPLFLEVLGICWTQGLVGKGMFAVDGCKISSNCSKDWSGTRADFEKKIKKLEKSINFLLAKHREMDEQDADDTILKKEKAAIAKLQERASKIKEWLHKHDDKRGSRGAIKKSNITDNESAKMPSSHGVVQGYNAVAAVDAKHQVIVHGEAFGEGQEHSLLEPMVEGIRGNFGKIAPEADAFNDAVLVADSGYNSEQNMEMLFTNKIDAYVADNGFRKRDPRFAKASRYGDGLHGRKRPSSKTGKFRSPDFHYDAARGTCHCPAGKELDLYRESVVIRGYRAICFISKATDCQACQLRTHCLRNEQTRQRLVYIFDHKGRVDKVTFTQRMRERFDTVKGRYLYSRRMGIVEPVFGNICSTLGLDRFSLRGKAKVNTQWLLFCIVHNIGKIWKYGPAFASG